MLQLPIQSTVAIGDSLQHDIQGMNEGMFAADRCSLSHACHYTQPRQYSMHQHLHREAFIMHCDTGVLFCTVLSLISTKANPRAGAHSAGVDSVFITGGIHAKDIAGADGKFDSQKMGHLLTQHRGRPTYTMPCLAV